MHSCLKLFLLIINFKLSWTHPYLNSFSFYHIMPCCTQMKLYCLGEIFQLFALWIFLNICYALNMNQFCKTLCPHSWTYDLHCIPICSTIRTNTSFSINLKPLIELHICLFLLLDYKLLNGWYCHFLVQHNACQNALNIYYWTLNCGWFLLDP